MGVIERFNEHGQPDSSKKHLAIEQQLEQVKRELERASQERHVLAEKLDHMRVFVDEISARLVTVESLDQSPTNTSSIAEGVSSSSKLGSSESRLRLFFQTSKNSMTPNSGVVLAVNFPTARA